jgi:Flp pilus assembly pilin Flp
MFLHADLHAVRAQQWLRRAATRPLQPRMTATRDDRGQATAEYGLVILAAGIALGVIAWAAKTGTFTDLFETVVDKLSDGL